MFNRPVSKLAFVTPWYGKDIPGGAERATRGLVQHLQQDGFEVKVLTTCIRDFYGDWGKNFYKGGLEQVDGIKVRRFPVQNRDRLAFEQINWRLMNDLSISAEEEITFMAEMIKAPELYEYIKQHQQAYLFFFVTYMYATTYHGSQIVPDRSIIITNLHDEAYARLGIYQKPLQEALALIFMTDAEKKLAEEILGKNQNQIRPVIGGGLDIDSPGDAGRFRQKYGLDEPFVLYAGRREAGKNTPLLIDYWQRYQSNKARNVKLVLIGTGDVNIPPRSDDSIIDLGFVSEQDKCDAYAAANVFCNPSIQESFSLVIMESWLAARPVLVHINCAVNLEHCQKANGGLYFSNYEEFSATLEYLLVNQEIASKLGKQGRQYVLQNYRWDIIVEQYRGFLRELLA